MWVWPAFLLPILAAPQLMGHPVFCGVLALTSNYTHSSYRMDFDWFQDGWTKLVTVNHLQSKSRGSCPPSGARDGATNCQMHRDRDLRVPVSKVYMA